MKGAVSAQRALQGSETDTRDCKCFLDNGSLICPPAKSMIFYLSVPLIFNLLCVLALPDVYPRKPN